MPPWYRNWKPSRIRKQNETGIGSHGLQKLDLRAGARLSFSSFEANIALVDKRHCLIDKKAAFMALLEDSSQKPAETALALQFKVQEFKTLEPENA